MQPDVMQMLADTGLSRLEAEVYLALLRQSPQTGYRVARQLGKPFPNTYQALESLQAKGAVLVEESGRSRQFTALEPAAYLDHLERVFQARRVATLEALQGQQAPSPEEGVYRLVNRQQVWQRAEDMLARAEEVVGGDICPDPLTELGGALTEAGRRGVRVFVKTYAPVDLAKVEMACAPGLPSPLGRWPADWLHLVIDGREHLTALFSRRDGEVLRASWCKSPFLSLVAHSGFAAEFLLTRLSAQVETGISTEAVDAAFEELSALLTRNLPRIQDYVAGLEAEPRGGNRS